MQIWGKTPFQSSGFETKLSEVFLIFWEANLKKFFVSGRKTKMKHSLQTHENIQARTVYST